MLAMDYQRQTAHLLAQMETAQGVEALAAAGGRLDHLLAEMVDSGQQVADILAAAASVHHRMTCRVLQLAEKELESSGLGKAPCRWCWINMGSAARKEQTLRTDQDNGLIFDHGSDPERLNEAEPFFKNLAALAVESLVRCGFAPCPGGVMAVSAKWRGPLDKWKARINNWMNSADPKDTRNLSILLDFQPVWGDHRLAQSIHRLAFDAFAASMAARHMLSCDDHTFAPPLGLLGAIVTEKSGPHKGQLNVKSSAIVHLVNGVRLLAIKNKIETASTLERIANLESMGALSATEASQLRDSFQTLMYFRIRENLKKYRQGRQADNYIDPHRLARTERRRLKTALAVVVRFQKRIANDFKVPWLMFFGS